MKPETPITPIDISQQWYAISKALIAKISVCEDVDREGYFTPLLKRGKVEKLPGDYAMSTATFRYTLPLADFPPGRLDLQVQVCTNLHHTNRHVSDGLNQALAVVDVSLIIDGLPHNPFIQLIPSDVVLIVGYGCAEVLAAFAHPTKETE